MTAPEEQALLKIPFHNPELLSTALVHGSFLNENPGVARESNERLEFLGDAVIGAVVAHELYSRHPDWHEGDLTHGRAALVRGEALAIAARRLDLGSRLLMGKGEESGGGRERPSNLAAAFESLVGAVYIDQGYEAARKLIVSVLDQEIGAVSGRRAIMNSKSALQEMLQRRGIPPPTYKTVSSAGADHARTFTVEAMVRGKVVGRGVGPKKAQAEQAAAAEALELLSSPKGE